MLGRISSFYYLSHFTLRMFKSRLKNELKMEDVLNVLCDAHEYDQLPVRHNEDQMNAYVLSQCVLAYQTSPVFLLRFVTFFWRSFPRIP